MLWHKGDLRGGGLVLVVVITQVISDTDLDMNVAPLFVSWF